ncbi:Rho guanine nucleotide exchange factor 25 [Mytilus edulis]|uniref:Rho guanine nucleotide exchange factor 25 n=1 Tax=Mytilus edulis TaxID=6550 RepID=A0A8S3R7B6_MYTED|nr:Rho guanine nucleotide exchange factor 25 [Mytilus edulis]
MKKFCSQWSFVWTLQDQQEAHVQPQHNQVTVVAQKKPLEVAEDDADDIDLPTVPPPMKIQDHIFKAASKEDSSEDLSKKASTLTIQPDTENAVKDLEDMVNQRVGDPNHDNPFDHQLSSESGGETADDPVSELTEEKKEMYREKRSYVMQELLDTEKDYVKDLGLIVEGYMEYLKEHGMPEDLQGKDKIVFGNIHQIYDWHRENFSPEIEKAVWDVDQLGSLFTRYDIQKYTDRAGEDTKSLKRALAVMCVVPKAANDMMQVGRLQGFDGKITAQGKLLLQDTLLVSEISQGQSQPKFKERRVFLFEQIILFSEMSEKKRGDLSNANYVYKNSIKVNNMALTKQVEGEPLRFMLINKTPGSDCKFVIQAPSDAIKHTWTEQITSLLDMQGDFLRALQSPIEYQNKVRKETKS